MTKSLRPLVIIRIKYTYTNIFVSLSLIIHIKQKGRAGFSLAAIQYEKGFNKKAFIKSSKNDTVTNACSQIIVHVLIKFSKLGNISRCSMKVTCKKKKKAVYK